MKHLLFCSTLLLLVARAGYSQFVFEDVTESSKLNQQSMGTVNVGPGVVVLDLDNDGWEDLYLPGGLFKDKLYRNMHDGTFVDISDSTFQVHNDLRSRTRGGTAFDFDNDGLTDIYATTQNTDLLWKNNGDGTFTNVSTSAGIIGSLLSQNQSNGASYGDLDGDGDNDFYVARWTEEFKISIDSVNGQVYTYQNRGFPEWLYMNNGDGTFSERAKELGVDGDTGCTNISLLFDYDRDGDLDIFAGNDFGVQEMGNRVFKNMLSETGKLSFVDMTDSIGLDCHIFCMGIGASDFDRDGDFDFYETNVGPDILLENRNNKFIDVSTEKGVPSGYATRNPDSLTTSWTALFADFDCDGWEDGFIVHGYIPTIPPWTAGMTDTSKFLRNVGGRFEEDKTNAKILKSGRAKGGALLDYDNDGKADICIGTLGFYDPPGVKIPDFFLYHNITPSAGSGHWLNLKFTARRTAREAIGTIVDVWVNGVVRSRQINTGGGQGSYNSLTAFVGLGSNTKADSINVFWPMDKNHHRQIDHYENVAGDHLYYVSENMGSKPDTSLLSLTRPIFSSAVNRGSSRPFPEIYPNPARDVLNIRNQQASAENRYEIYDLLGKRLIDLKGTESAFSFSVANLKAGCYVLRLTSSGGTVTKQFIKE